MDLPGSLHVASVVVSGVATVLAWALAERREEHRPVAWLLSVGLARDVGLHVVGTVYAGHPEPLLAYLSDALYLAWPASIAGAAIVVCLGKRAWAVAVGWAAAVLAILITQPKASTGDLGRALLGSATAAVLVAGDALAMGVHRRGVAGAGPARTAIAIVVAAEAVTLAAAWWVGLFEEWRAGPIAHIAASSAVAAVQAWSLLRARTA